MVLNFEKEFVVKELKERKPKSVLVQLPEGVKQNVSEIVNLIEGVEIEGKGIEVIVSGESCWGACAVAVQEAEALGVDLIVHFGHAEFIKVAFPILYVEVQDVLNLDPILEKTIPELKDYKKIGLSYSIQHRHDVDKIKKFLEDNGKEVVLSKKMGTAAYEGHVVGCEYNGLRAIQKDVDAFLVVGNQFHSMGATLGVEKPVVLMDVYNDNVRNMKGLRDKILKQRAISIEKLKEAKTVGIIVEIKPGQKFGSPKYLVDKFKEQGKNVVVITMSEMTPDKIMNFYNVDCFVELACPRIAVDDFAKYHKPIVTFKEALVALGIKTWDEIIKLGVV